MVVRRTKQDRLDEINARMNTAKAREIFRERKKIVEHPFGTAKAVWGFKQFLCWTREKVTGEQSLAFWRTTFGGSLTFSGETVRAWRRRWCDVRRHAVFRHKD
ncbi:MAG: hypothetical protein LBK41_08900 [Clostridiales bacterium]|jgi:hypothetical protein|nr:hypothetical protein [Clostridiales bacterium]